MRITYGKLIDFSIERSGAASIEFTVHSQYPDTVADRFYNPTKKNEIRKKFYADFNVSNKLDKYGIGSYNYPEIYSDSMYLWGDSSDNTRTRTSYFGSREKRDEVFDRALLTMKKWSEFPPCKELWFIVRTQEQLQLL